MPPPDESPPRIRSTLPARIGRYRITDRVGRGAMGVVYAAEDDAMGRPVAVKVLMGDLESDPETRARFYREAQAAAGLLHPNIITIYDAGEDQGRSYIAMQLLEGWPLAAYLKQPEAAPVERKLDLMVQMCEGLAAAHGRGIVHRDLKPGNLFVQSDGLLKILDFGVARLADSSMTATGAMLGTPDYMSPEQARGTQVDARSDIFSAGAVFYFMLAGRKPFPGPDLPAVLHQLQFEQPVALRESDAPPELAQLVMQAMAKEPADRPPRVQELLAGIVRFRRQYQAGTRKLVAEAAAGYDALVAAAAELRRAAEILDLAPVDEPAALRTLRERFPALADRGGVALEAVAFDRARVTHVLRELDAERQRIDGELTTHAGMARMFEESQQALDRGDARSALALLQQVSSACGSSRKVTERLERAAADVQAQDARDRRVNEIMAAARRALEARDWTTTIERCEEALRIVADLPAAASMLVEAQQGVAREARRRALLLQQSLDRAAVAIEEGRFDDAETALREIDALEPHSTAAGDLRLELEESRAAAAEAERVRRQTADEIRRARGAFRRGRFDEALSALQAFVRVHPEAALASSEAERLAALRDRIVDTARERRLQSSALARAAQTLAERGAFDDALARAREAVLTDPADADASALLDEMIERDLEARIDHERTRVREQRSIDGEPLVAAAREAHARGYLALAIDAAAGALRIAPHRADVAAYVEELHRLAESEDEDAFELGDEPFAPPPRQERLAAPPDPAADAPDRPPDGGVFSHVNQWAAGLWRRRLPNR